MNASRRMLPTNTTMTTGTTTIVEVAELSCVDKRNSNRIVECISNGINQNTLRLQYKSQPYDYHNNNNNNNKNEDQGQEPVVGYSGIAVIKASVHWTGEQIDVSSCAWRGTNVNSIPIQKPESKNQWERKASGWNQNISMPLPTEFNKSISFPLYSLQNSIVNNSILPIPTTLQKRSCFTTTPLVSINTRKSISTQSKKRIIIPCEHDVLLGRGGRTNNHIGNQRYRQVKELLQRQYIAGELYNTPELRAAKRSQYKDRYCHY